MVKGGAVFLGDAVFFWGVLSRKRPQAPAKLLGQIQRVCEWKSFLKKVFYRGLRKRVSVATVGYSPCGFSPVDRGETQSSWFECPNLRSRRGRPTGTSCQLYPAAGNSHVSSPVRVLLLKFSDRGATPLWMRFAFPPLPCHVHGGETAGSRRSLTSTKVGVTSLHLCGRALPLG